MTNMTKNNDFLSDKSLDCVAGGLNPQPLPPGPPPDLFAMRSFASLFSRFAINQHTFAVNFFKFR